MPEKHFPKPCHRLGWCPYGSLVEYFPLHGKAVQYNGKSLDIEPLPGERRKDSISCGVFGHDCPVFYCGEAMEEPDAPQTADADIPVDAIEAILNYNWDEEEPDYKNWKEENPEEVGKMAHIFESMEVVKRWLAQTDLRPECPLHHKQENDFVLKGEGSVWIEKDSLVVYIHQRESGVPYGGLIVDIMKTGDEDGEVLDSAQAFFEKEDEVL